MHWLEGVIIIGAGFIPFLIVTGRFPADPQKRQDLEVRLPRGQESKTYVRNGGFPLGLWRRCRSGPYEVARHKAPMPAGTGASLRSSGWRRVRDFSSIRPFLRGISHLGDGASSLLAEMPRART